MHCPKCGQQQITEQTRFCSRCGFQLGFVAQLLENGGFFPQLAQLNTSKSTFFTRKNGLIFTALWFIFWVMMLPAFFGLANEDDAAGVSAVFGIFTTMMLLIISLAVLKRTPKVFEIPAHQLPVATPDAMYANPSIGALPSQQTQPASTYMPPEGAWRVPDTGDLVRPGSVTENTTRLLKKDE